jgi:hypothetical protein
MSRDECAAEGRPVARVLLKDNTKPGTCASRPNGPVAVVQRIDDAVPSSLTLGEQAPAGSFNHASTIGCVARSMGSPRGALRRKQCWDVCSDSLRFLAFSAALSRVGAVRLPSSLGHAEDGTSTCRSSRGTEDAAEHGRRPCRACGRDHAGRRDQAPSRVRESLGRPI